MERPKSIEAVCVKLPQELRLDLELEAARRTLGARRRDPKAAHVTVSEVIKDCCEFRLRLIRALTLSYYQLRTLLPLDGENPGHTSDRKVIPDSFGA